MPDPEKLVALRRAQKQRKRKTPPVTVAPDQQDRSTAARTENLERGAAPSGGPGRASRRRAERVIKRADQGKATAREVQMLLRKEGYDIKADDVWGPVTQKTWTEYRRTQLEGERENIQTRQRMYLKTAFSRPPRPELELELFGPEGVKELAEARERLQTQRSVGLNRQKEMRGPAVAQDQNERAFAEAMKRGDYETAQQFRPEGDDDDGLLDAITQSASRAGEIWKQTGEVLGDLSVDFAKNPNDFIFGEEAMKAFYGEDFDPAWAAAEGVMLPSGWGKGAKKVIGAVRGARGADEAAEVLPVEEAVEELGPSAAERVSQSLGPARARRAAQQGLYREERGKRVQAAKEAEEQAGGGIEGHQAAKAQLKGELPKVKFTKLSEGKLNQDELDDLFRQIDDHPDLEFYGRLNARQALLNAFEHNSTPRKFEIELLQTVFGQDATDEIARLSMAKRFGVNVMETLNVPRSLMASFDMSAPFRQALVAGAGHPGIFFRNFAPMVKAARSEKAYKEIMGEIKERPNADLYDQSGLKLTELGDLDKREEQFMSNFAEKIPGVGRVVRGSGRAYTGFLNKMRADVFDNLLDVARAEGNNVEDRKFLRSLAKYINSSTGRGSLGPIEDWAPALNTVFFSPRLMASRINFLDPTWYMRLDPFARKQALKSITRLAGAASVVLGLGAASGVAEVGHDPRSADFGKLRIGDTRVDILGGFQQYIRLASQVISGEIVSSSTGRMMKLESGVGNLSRKDILERFFTGKFAPPPSFLYDFFKGTDFEGEPFDVKVAILERTIPLMAQDVRDLYSETGNIPLAIGAYGVGGLGIGIQTYDTPDVGQKAVDKLAEEAEKWGVDPPSEKVKEAARYRALLHDDYESLSKPERAKRLARLLDERRGGSALSERIESIVGDDDEKAEWFTRKFSRWLYPELILYEAKIDAQEDRAIESG